VSPAQAPGDQDARLAALAERVRRVTVEVRGAGRGHGSGVIWGREGQIVTNAHVARGRPTVVLSDGRVFEAHVVAWDPARDLAALRIGARELPAAEIGDSDALRVGELVFAVGSPFGLRGALSTGMVHAVPRGGPDGSRFIRADLRLAPGNSGGPLADARGRVVGINAMIHGGLALAIPSNVVEGFLGARAGAGP
jgi:serine protease Do